MKRRVPNTGRDTLPQLLARGDVNRAVGWTSLVLGAATGLVIGLWSFDGPAAVPAWIGDYGATPRRLLRLGHIAFFGLGVINVLMARELPPLAVAGAVRRTAFHAMNFGNLVLPVTLVGAALQPALKWALPIPALAVFAALCLMAFATFASVDDRCAAPGGPHGERRRQ